MRFWDTSAIIPLFLDQPDSERMASLLVADNELVVWWGTIVECQSAIARARRQALLNTQQESQANVVLQRLTDLWVEIEPTEAVRSQATLLPARHPLRAADALQLSAALVWAGPDPRDYRFISLDRRLREAASSEGFVVLPA